MGYAAACLAIVCFAFRKAKGLKVSARPLFLLWALNLGAVSTSSANRFFDLWPRVTFLCEACIFMILLGVGYFFLFSRMEKGYLAFSFRKGSEKFFSKAKS